MSGEWWAGAKSPPPRLSASGVGKLLFKTHPRPTEDCYIRHFVIHNNLSSVSRPPTHPINCAYEAPEGSARRRLHGEAFCHEPTPHRLGEEGGQRLPILVQAPAGGGPRNRSHPAFRPRPLPPSGRLTLPPGDALDSD